MRDKFFYFWFALVLVVSVVIGGFQIKGAIECNEKGGAYIAASGQWPICVKVASL